MKVKASFNVSGIVGPLHQIIEVSENTIEEANEELSKIMVEVGLVTSKGKPKKFHIFFMEPVESDDHVGNN